jgi:hypothetical protein
MNASRVAASVTATAPGPTIRVRHELVSAGRSAAPTRGSTVTRAEIARRPLAHGSICSVITEQSVALSSYTRYDLARSNTTMITGRPTAVPMPDNTGEECT